MTTLREAAQQALEALEDARRHNYALKHRETDSLVTDLRAALKQPEKEPVATVTVNESMGAEFKFARPHTLMPGQVLYVYTAPRREWQGLTEEDMIDIQDRCGVTILRDEFLAIEAALKERNA